MCGKQALSTASSSQRGKARLTEAHRSLQVAQKVQRRSRNDPAACGDGSESKAPSQSVLKSSVFESLSHEGFFFVAGRIADAPCPHQYSDRESKEISRRAQNGCRRASGQVCESQRVSRLTERERHVAPAALVR